MSSGLVRSEAVWISAWIAFALYFNRVKLLLRLIGWAGKHELERLAHSAFYLMRFLSRRSPVVQYLAFLVDVRALRESGKIEAAARLAVEHCSKMTWADHRNTAIDILVSAGAYREALVAGLTPYVPVNMEEILSLTLIQINLSEAEYSLGLWQEAEERLRRLDDACVDHPITRAGLLVQRAWIAAHNGRLQEAINLCAAVDPLWFPKSYRAEQHFCASVAFLLAGKLDEAEAALARGERVLHRLSSKRNFLILRARISAARGDWVAAERDCRAAAKHAHRGQGGDGFVLWAESLRKLGREAEAEEALRLLQERDPQSEAAQRHRTQRSA